MARPVRRPRALEYQVFRARDALDAGLLTPNELRGRRSSPAAPDSPASADTSTKIKAMSGTLW